MRVYVNGIGMLGPGFDGWREGREVLLGARCYRETTPPEPPATILPPNEHRRSSDTVRWAVHVAQEAIEQAQADPKEMATVFASSSGESSILDQLCTALTTFERVISPTLFHQSVHNAAAGYWGIATSCQQSSTALSCYNSSFCGGLLEAAAYVSAEAKAILLVAYDLPLPLPLSEAQPIPGRFAVALTLVNRSSLRSLARLDLTLNNESAEPVTTMNDAGLEGLRLGNPAARSLPLLSAIAKRQAVPVRLDYLEDQHLLIEVTPCEL